MKPRFLGRPGSAYHVISRFVDRQYALGSEEAKRVFHDLMIRHADFSGVELLTFCIMGNHFHILVRVPEAPSEIPEREVLRRLGRIWPKKRVRELTEKLDWLRETSAEGEKLVERELDRFRRRMYSLSEFVKDLKQRFSRWFNFHNGRKGTLFEERFKSVLVESGQALRTIAAYIDLNPVRAGIVEDPVDYKWSGYARAVGGNRERRRALRTIVFEPHGPRMTGVAKPPSWAETSKRYRLVLYGKGPERRNADGTVRKRGFTREESLAAWNADGTVPAAKLLRCQARYFCDTVVYGSREFVEELIEANRERLGVHPKAHPDTSGLCGLVRIRGETTG